MQLKTCWYCVTLEIQSIVCIFTELFHIYNVTGKLEFIYINFWLFYFSVVLIMTFS